MKPHAPEACAAFLGLDGADATHASGLQAAGAARRGFLGLAHRPEAIDAWVQTLRTRCHGHPVAGGLELHQGPMVSARRPEDVLGRFPVHPFPLATDREALTPSRAKDAPTDAELQGALLLTHRDTRTPLTPQSPTMRA